MQILHISTVSLLSFSMYTLALPAPHPDAPAGPGADILGIPTSLSSNEKTLAALPETKDLGTDKSGIDGKKDETKAPAGLGDNELKKKDPLTKEDTKAPAGLGGSDSKKKDPLSASGPLGADVKTPGATPGEIPEQCRQYIKDSPPKSTPPKSTPSTPVPPKVTPPKVTPPVHEAPKTSPPTKTENFKAHRLYSLLHSQAQFWYMLSLLSSSEAIKTYLEQDRIRKNLFLKLEA
ncbi:uncharacterized protein MELLADRAFT_61173 [Melampsora larici-populina 98AG31]|uniref:Secreted protein n=1 Tax=Melampsora larici-populina (strain 98AG31 / pathotype 3-4-7) TaxID=747676 RepID=F4RDV9_MELLP|nr:uncharacterized protein MELLADRAFT_61173 [Melampsora larici-populina 98AG31]EGG09472.1 hypothetical protein MELLADRAFT_61173 [Melampsora larici-populina 98AG31]